MEIASHRVHLNSIASMIIYFLPFDGFRFSSSLIKRKHAHYLFVCCLDQFICIGLLILIIGQINVCYCCYCVRVCICCHLRKKICIAVCR